MLNEAPMRFNIRSLKNRAVKVKNDPKAYLKELESEIIRGLNKLKRNPEEIEKLMNEINRDLGLNLGYKNSTEVVIR